MTPPSPDVLIEAAARAAHEAIRAYCAVIGDPCQPPWPEAYESHRTSMRLGVQSVLDGKNPAEIHEAWRRHRTEEGWVFGPVKDEALRRHPNLVPYSELSPAQQCKDSVFLAVVGVMASTLGPYTWSCSTLQPRRA